MKNVFRAIYLVFGVAGLFLLLLPGRWGILGGAFALLSLYAAWGMFFGGGLGLRFVHASVGTVVVFAWVVSWFGVALALFSYVGFFLVIVAMALTIPAVAYCADLAIWLRRQLKAHDRNASVGNPLPQVANSSTRLDEAGNPVAGRVFNTKMAVLTLSAWAACWFYVVLALLEVVPRRVGGVLSVEHVHVLGLMLTLPALAYVVGYVRSRDRDPVERSSRETPGLSDPPPSTTHALEPASPFFARLPLRRVGAVALLVLIAGLALRAFIGDDFLCHRGSWESCKAVAERGVKLRIWDESPCRFDSAWRYNEDTQVCRMVGERYVERGDPEGAIRLFDKFWDRYKQTLVRENTNAVDMVWADRTQLLIDTHDFARIDKVADEMCGPTIYMPHYCGALMLALERAHETSVGARVLKGLCDNHPDDTCSMLADSLISAGANAEGMLLLRNSCELGTGSSCMRLGSQLGRGSKVEARAAMKRACELNFALCHRVLLDERAFASTEEVRADAMDVCARYPGQCTAVAKFLKQDARDETGARQLLQLMCDRITDGAKPSECGVEVRQQHRIALYPPPERLSFVEFGAVVTRFDWSRGSLRIQSVDRRDGGTGKILQELTVAPTVASWKKLDQRLLAADIWSWPPVTDPLNRNNDGVAWKFEVIAGVESFASLGYSTFPAHYAELKAAIEELAETSQALSSTSRRKGADRGEGSLAVEGPRR